MRCAFKPLLSNVIQTCAKVGKNNEKTAKQPQKVFCNFSIL